MFYAQPLNITHPSRESGLHTSCLLIIIVSYKLWKFAKVAFVSSVASCIQSRRGTREW